MCHCDIGRAISRIQSARGPIRIIFWFEFPAYSAWTVNLFDFDLFASLSSPAHDTNKIKSFSWKSSGEKNANDKNAIRFAIHGVAAQFLFNEPTNRPFKLAVAGTELFSPSSSSIASHSLQTHTAHSSQLSGSESRILVIVWIYSASLFRRTKTSISKYGIVKYNITPQLKEGKCADRMERVKRSEMRLSTEKLNGNENVLVN